MKTGCLVREVMATDPLCTTQNVSVSECAVRMRDEAIGSLVVVDGGSIIGIVTEQDLSRKVLAQGIPPSVPVATIMSRSITSVSPNQDIYEAMVIMGSKNIKHLPVIENGSLIGLVSFKDIIGVSPGLIELLSFKKSAGDLKKKVFRNER